MSNTESAAILTWRTADISWACAALKEHTIFDADALQREWDAMKTIALAAEAAAPVVPQQAAHNASNINDLAANSAAQVAAPVVLVDRNAEADADEPTEREALIACLGDDAAKLEDHNPGDEMAQTMRDAAAMLESDGVPQLAVPQGWKPVPIEPTEAMIYAARLLDNWGRAPDFPAIWRDMLAAAPAAPTVQDAPSDERTDLQREIAEDADAFEATLPYKPARAKSSTYPWGWMYISDATQRAFREFVAGRATTASGKLIAAPVSGEVVRPDLAKLRRFEPGSDGEMHEHHVGDWVSLLEVGKAVAAAFPAPQAPDQTTGEKQ